MKRGGFIVSIPLLIPAALAAAKAAAAGAARAAMAAWGVSVDQAVKVIERGKGG